jgi:hypothetical protein
MAAAAFCSCHAPVILLANQKSHPLTPWTFRTLMKPLLGVSLTDAVFEAVAARKVTT